MEDSKLFYLVEYGENGYIKRRDLFSTSKQAKHFLEKELYLEYDKASKFWHRAGTGYFAELITLILNDNAN